MRELTSLTGRNKAEAPEVRPPGFTDRQPFPCNARLASGYPSDAQTIPVARPLIPRPGLLLRALPPNYPLTDRRHSDILAIWPWLAGTECNSID